MRHPRLRAAGGLDRGGGQVGGRRAGPGDAEDGVDDRPPPLELRRAARAFGSSPDDPGAPEVGVEAAVADAGVDPQHVALDRARARSTAAGRRGRRSSSTARRRCSCGITCQIGSRMLASAPASKIVRRNVAVRSVWRTPGASRACTSAIACSVMRRASRMQASSSGVLISLGLADDPAARRRASRRPSSERCPAQRVRPLVDRDDGVRRHQLGELRQRSSSTPSSKSRCAGPWTWSAGSPARSRSSARIGENRCGDSSSASTTATGCSKLTRPASASGQIAPVA